MINMSMEACLASAYNQAYEAYKKNSYGVGGVMVNAQNGSIIRQMQNTVITDNRLLDPTCHGERQLVDWYYTQTNLPPPKDIIIISTLDPCCMCTGSILTAGFKVIVAALDTQAGINYDGKYNFKPFQGDLAKQIKESFIYPEIIGVRNGFGKIPSIFPDKNFKKDIVDACNKVFIDGANNARKIVEKMTIPPENLKNPKSDETPENILDELRKTYPDALKYTSPRRGKPDKNLLPFLEEACQIDIDNGGKGDAVAFLDYFGNLLICKPGNIRQSKTRTAYMETIRSYTKLRFDLTKKNSDALYYLHEPKHGTFVFYNGFEFTAPSFMDMGAYGSTILGELKNDRNLLYYKEQILPLALKKFIAEMPPRYNKLLKPEQWTP
jgi:cytosine deaminase